MLTWPEKIRFTASLVKRDQGRSTLKKEWTILMDQFAPQEHILNRSIKFLLPMSRITELYIRPDRNFLTILLTAESLPQKSMAPRWLFWMVPTEQLCLTSIS